MEVTFIHSMDFFLLANLGLTCTKDYESDFLIARIISNFCISSFLPG